MRGPVSLLNEIAQTCVLLKNTPVPDGAGGSIVLWTEDQTFSCRLVRSSSREARKAEKPGADSLYTCMIGADVPLQYGDFFRNQSSGEVFRAVSNPNDMRIPKTASPMLAGKLIFTAEKTELPR